MADPRGGEGTMPSNIETGSQATATVVRATESNKGILGRLKGLGSLFKRKDTRPTVEDLQKRDPMKGDPPFDWRSTEVKPSNEIVQPRGETDPEKITGFNPSISLVETPLPPKPKVNFNGPNQAIPMEDYRARTTPKPPSEGLGHKLINVATAAAVVGNVAAVGYHASESAPIANAETPIVRDQNYGRGVEDEKPNDPYKMTIDGQGEDSLLHNSNPINQTIDNGNYTPPQVSENRPSLIAAEEGKEERLKAPPPPDLLMAEEALGQGQLKPEASPEPITTPDNQFNVSSPVATGYSDTKNVTIENPTGQPVADSPEEEAIIPNSQIATPAPTLDPAHTAPERIDSMTDPENAPIVSTTETPTPEPVESPTATNTAILDPSGTPYTEDFQEAAAKAHGVSTEQAQTSRATPTIPPSSKEPTTSN